MLIAISKCNTSCISLGIKQQTLKDSFKKATEEARIQREAAFLERLQKLVADGKLTQKQVDDFKAWLKGN